MTKHKDSAKESAKESDKESDKEVVLKEKIGSESKDDKDNKPEKIKDELNQPEITEQIPKGLAPPLLIRQIGYYKELAGFVEEDYINSDSE